ncbi:copine-8-like isoform X2 [Bacillus rossius redtenbacheri]
MCKDILSKSDPLCITYIRPFGEDRWVEYHRTEVINECHDPVFVSKPVMSYCFEEQQYLRFEVYDTDSTSSDLRDHDFLGAAVCTLAQIISSGKVELPLSQSGVKAAGDTGFGHLVVVAEELDSAKDEVVLQFSGHGLDKKNWWCFGQSDPFLAIYKVMESGAYTLVHRTEVIEGTLNPKWKKFIIPVRRLCNGDYDRSMRIACCDWNNDGEEKLIGELYTTLRELSAGPGVSTVYPCINPKKKSKLSYSNSGQIRLDYYEVRKIHSFMDYLKGGTQIHCSFAVDFTASNGDPASPDSLHYVSQVPNMYELAIQAVGSIIQDYDSDKMFPVLGFGAKIPPTGHVSHEFFVNLREDSPYCHTVSGVLEAYHNCVRQVQLYGPTNFAPVINHVARFASTFKNGSAYFILLILTDGVITDMPQTTHALVEASVLPMSVIIVGIGSADFSAMEVLDADSVPLQSGGRRAARDIVQFVPFSKFVGAGGGDPRTARLRLAKEVLAEVPRQFVAYMKANSISPGPPSQDVTLLPPDPEVLGTALQ